jgi:hypothetical protein
MGPCDILGAAGNTCVAAHSTVRALYGAYTGPLYQVCKGTSGTGPNSCTSGVTLNIGTVAGGVADSAAQDMFCTGAICTISIIYDQSPMKNDLRPAPTGGNNKGMQSAPVPATALPTTLNGHKVYGVLIKPEANPLPGNGYRSGCVGCLTPTAKGTATGDQPETEYMVTSQNGQLTGCCFDYGNAETSTNDNGNGFMEAVYFGNGDAWGTGAGGSPANRTAAPWVMADLENGVFAGWNNGSAQGIASNTNLRFNFVTAVVVGDVASQNGGLGRFALFGADATNGPLRVEYDGQRPTPGYVPMQKKGSIILGIGGDSSNTAGGEWFEGVMASGVATLATCNLFQANIVAAGYGK